MDQINGGSYDNFTYRVQIDEGLLDIQNLIVVRVTDVNGLRVEEDIIVFK